MNVFDLMAKIGLDTSEYESGLENSKGLFNSFGSTIKSGIGAVGKATFNAIQTVATGVGNMAQNIASSSADLANYGDSIDKASQKIGISAKAYQEWEAVMQHSGTSMDSMTATFKTLSNASQSASEDQAAAFEKLGMSLDDISKMSTEDLFKTVITGLQGMEEGTERTAIASQLLGRGAMELGALLNTSAEDTQGMIDEVNRLGGVMSDEAVKSSAEFNDNLQDMTTAIDGFKRGVTAQFLPGISLLMKGFTSLISGGDNAKRQLIAAFARIGNGLEEAIKTVSGIATTLIPTIVRTAVELLPTLGTLAFDIIDTLVTTVTENAPLMIDTAVALIGNLVDGFAVMLPRITFAAVEIILALADKLTEDTMLDKLIDAAIVLIVALSEGIVEHLPKLIEKSVVIVERLVEAIIRNAPKLLKAAFEVIAHLASGIIDSLPHLLTAQTKITNTFKDGIRNLVDSAKTWGWDLITNFVGGIKANWDKLKNAVSDVAQTVKDFLGFSEPKKGPLSNFHTYAPDMMDLFSQGIKENTSKVTDQLDSSLSRVSDAFSADSYSGGNTFNITVSAGTISSDYDSYRAAQLISEQLAQLQTSQRIAVGGV